MGALHDTSFRKKKKDFIFPCLTSGRNGSGGGVRCEVLGCMSRIDKCYFITCIYCNGITLTIELNGLPTLLRALGWSKIGSQAALLTQPSDCETCNKVASDVHKAINLKLNVINMSFLYGG